MAGLLLLCCPAFVRAQLSGPIATPTATVAPVAGPVPEASPTTAPAPPSVPNSPSDWSAYRQARTPAVTVVLTAANAQSSLPNQSQANKVASITKATSGQAATATLQPQATGGVLDEINLGPLHGTTPPPAASLTLQYDASLAGTAVWIQTLDGGTLQAQDADGKTITAPGSFWIEIGSTGQLTFTFQALARSAQFRVLLRLNNVSTIVPFVVPDPAQEN